MISNLEETSEIDGGKGDDTVTFDGVGGRYQPVLTSVETLTLDQKAGQILPKLQLRATRFPVLKIWLSAVWMLRKTSFFAEYATGELNVNAVGDNAGNLEIGDVDQINMTVGGTKGPGAFSGKVILNDTSSLNLTVGNTTERGDVFSGDIIGTELEKSVHCGQSQQSGEQQRTNCDLWEKVQILLAFRILRSAVSAAWI